jgi:fatty acid desaturase
MTTTAPPQRGSDYSRLSKTVAAAGLMDRRPGYYTVKIGSTVALFVAGWVAVTLLGDSWWQAALAVPLAIVCTQMSFLGHDSGHRQIGRTRRSAVTLGLLHGNLATGLGYGWWMDKHTRHHANPNHEDEDPDVGSGALVWTHEQALETRGVQRWMARRQAYLFFPLLLLEGFNLHWASIRSIRDTPMKHRALEAVLLAVHTIGYLTLVLTSMSPLKALVFVLIHQGLWGLYMGLSFAPNHKGMPMLTAADDLDYLRKQVLTSRNVRGGLFTDLALGGLNYQIEHHLFPSMPRANLRRAQPIVRAFCKDLGVGYEETGLISSYGYALRHLHEVGAPLR